MKKKIWISLALVLGLVITGFAATAEAGNTVDTTYYFKFMMDGSSMVTPSRPKYDATSAYMKFNWIDDGAGTYKVKVTKPSGADFSRVWWSGYCYDYTVGTEHWIPNYAYEDGGYGVQVSLKGEGGGGVVGGGWWSTGGLWSPDSVGGP